MAKRKKSSSLIEVSEKRLEELRVRYERLTKEFPKVKIPKKFEHILKEKGGTAFIRCHKKLPSGKQCIRRSRLNKLFCNFHQPGYKKVISKKDKEMQKKTGIVLYTKSNEKILQKELKTISNKPIEELSDIRNDIARSEAILLKLLNQTKITVKPDGKKIKTKEAAEIEQVRLENKMARSIQYAIMMNVKIKETYWDVKFGDANTVSKDLFIYTFQKYNQIIQECVVDIEIIKNITERLKKLQIEIKERGMG